MYEIIATKDFIDVLKKLSLEYANVLTHSFISIREIPHVRVIKNTFMEDLLEQIKNQEVE
jgi:hypothetical protein